MRANHLTFSALRRCRHGFTLVEAALTTMIVGVGTVAMMGLLATGVNANQQAAYLTTAVDLANNVHELCDRLPFAASNNYWGVPSSQSMSNLMTAGNITWMDGQSFTPPIDATDNSIPSLGGWTQAVSVNSVDPANLVANATTKSTSAHPMERVTVVVSHSGQQMFTSTWLVAQ